VPPIGGCGTSGERLTAIIAVFQPPPDPSPAAKQLLSKIIMGDLEKTLLSRKYDFSLELNIIKPVGVGK